MADSACTRPLFSYCSDFHIFRRFYIVRLKTADVELYCSLSGRRLRNFALKFIFKKIWEDLWIPLQNGDTPYDTLLARPFDPKFYPKKFGDVCKRQIILRC